MNFASVLVSMKHGHRVKRYHCKGYWYLDNNKELIIHQFTGKDMNLRDTHNMLYTLENISCDDWEICDTYHAERELDKKDFINKPLTLEDVKNITNEYKFTLTALNEILNNA